MGAARYGLGIGAGLAAMLLAAPGSARDEAPTAPVTDQTVKAVDVAATPIEDLNLKKDEIPPLLIAAQNDPYSTAGLKRCSHYIAAIEELNAILGPDFDVAGPSERKMTAGTVAKSVVGSLIPFRGLIREISGANKHEREFQDAILSGVMRRAFLKGMGLKAGCRYPGRPADDAMRAQIADQQARDAAAKEAAGKDKAS